MFSGLTEHTQFRVGKNDPVRILSDALVHPGVFKRQAAERHLVPVQLRAISRSRQVTFKASVPNRIREQRAANQTAGC